MSGVFVTGTGTEIGKTVISFHLIRQLRRSGRPAVGLKPVASGVDDAELPASDPGRLVAATGAHVTSEAVERICPWRFAPPLAPDAAAARSGRELSFDALVDFVRAHPSEHLIVEGVGGVRVPLARRHTVADWIAATRLPAVLVTGSYLGAISHLLSALDALRVAGARVRGVVVSRSEQEPMPVEEMLEAAGPWIDEWPRVVVPRLEAPFDADLPIDLLGPLMI